MRRSTTAAVRERPAEGLVVLQRACAELAERMRESWKTSGSNRARWDTGMWEGRRRIWCMLYSMRPGSRA